MISKLIVVVLSMFSIVGMLLPGLSTIQQAQGMQTFVAPHVDDILDEVGINDEDDGDEEEQEDDDENQQSLGERLAESTLDAVFGEEEENDNGDEQSIEQESTQTPTTTTQRQLMYCFTFTNGGVLQPVCAPTRQECESILAEAEAAGAVIIRPCLPTP